ncbi:hypothetical protein BV25DRAFT_1915477 [Artomyces pyxidatus]|uniref:Uncharacterized protein n=1 Tax=Artomyces pyxidatus TaxID=48021 RepID=A0ACB8T3Q3_9AGAM|nr:hypothetical protein BV25DRAFT_1915477 [Artomyces pyxidatus]
MDPAQRPPVAGAGNPVDLYIAHPFNTDNAYQQGLSGIISTGAMQGLSERAREELLRKTRVYYFNQTTGNTITEDQAKEAEEASARGATDENTEALHDNASDRGEEPRLLSFAELQALIEQGATDKIPNNKHIPDVLSEDPPSQSTAAPRKKPWESK